MGRHKRYAQGGRHPVIFSGELIFDTTLTRVLSAEHPFSSTLDRVPYAWNLPLLPSTYCYVDYWRHDFHRMQWKLVFVSFPSSSHIVTFSQCSSLWHCKRRVVPQSGSYQFYQVDGLHSHLLCRLSSFRMVTSSKREGEHASHRLDSTPPNYSLAQKAR